MAKEYEISHEKDVEDLISKAFDRDSMIGFDAKISHLFESVFYSFSHNVVAMDMRREKTWYPGIVSHFLRNWKDSVGFSSISRTFPAIITGSIVEGACLSRIFHPSKADSLELEADVMYIVGSITKTVAEECFQDMQSTGFLRIKNSPEINIFTQDKVVNLQDIVATSNKDNNTGEFLNGSALKAMHQKMQPKNRRLWMHGDSTFVVGIHQQISGPSSEIIFTSKDIRDTEGLQMVVDFFERINERWVNECCQLLDSITKGQSMRQTCIDSLATAIARVEHDCFGPKNNARDGNSFIETETLSKDELINLLLAYQGLCKEINEKYVSVLDNEADIYFLINGGKSASNYRAKFDNIINKGLIRQVFDRASFEKADHLPLLQQLKKIRDQFENLLLEIDFYDLSFQVGIADRRNYLQGEVQRVVEKMKVKTVETFTNNLNKEADCESENFEEESTISFDNVSCFHCSFWPKIASEWKTRERNWPSPEQVQTILDAGCFVVAKPLRTESAESFLDWRWSFSSAEISIANFRTPVMKFCYFIFKSLFYRFLKKENEDGKYLPSYVAKTCMMYASEGMGEEWFDKNSTAYCVLSLFHRLRHFLTSGVVPHYFIPDLNLLTGMPKDVVDKALSTVSDMIENPCKYFVFHKENLERIEKIKKEVEDLHSLTSSSISTDPLKYFDSITQSRKEILLSKIEGIRCSRLLKLYQIWSKINNFNCTLPTIKDAIETQRKLFSFPGNEYMAEDARFQMNVQNYESSAKELSQLEKEESVERHEIQQLLARINNLFGKNCRRCQKCSVMIQCRSSQCYQCKEAVCTHTVCEKCYLFLQEDQKKKKKQGNSVEQHTHQLVQSEQCMQLCSAYINEEDIGKDMLMETYTLANKVTSTSKWKIRKGASNIGFTEKKFVSLFGGPGEGIVGEELQILFKVIYKGNDADRPQEESIQNDENGQHNGKLQPNEDSPCDNTVAGEQSNNLDLEGDIIKELEILKHELDKRKIIRLCLRGDRESYDEITTMAKKGIASDNTKVRKELDIGRSKEGENDSIKRLMAIFDPS